ncbi:hypothetical protein HJC10_13705 [Corallococcus exiguus]|uniref:hypothetical protein n=1 Tax=Corallococcus exiguus TaxID=83462 RepID=UPI0014719119|nr:hypothetical protein [Corallococcus exiguus]NNB87870.1 hypothetical protein [Corallococcus exiguus]NNB96973.1 hypothetical protein [Corallococcus exiguus]NNC03895.1 hypothetical protein [Corallococcus exiguus]
MRALSMMAMLWGASAAAQAAPTPFNVILTTKSLVGAAHDTVVASVVDAGVLGPSSTVPMTLRIVDDSGAVLATVTGTVSATVPLRVTVTAPSSAGLRAQLVLPPGAGKFSAGVLVIEREGQGFPPPPHTRLICEIPPHVSRDPETGGGDPVTIWTCKVEVERT